MSNLFPLPWRLLSSSHIIDGLCGGSSLSGLGEGSLSMLVLTLWRIGFIKVFLACFSVCIGVLYYGSGQEEHYEGCPRGGRGA